MEPSVPFPLKACGVWAVARPRLYCGQDRSYVGGRTACFTLCERVCGVCVCGVRVVLFRWVFVHPQKTQCLPQQPCYLTSTAVYRDSLIVWDTHGKATIIM